MVYLDYAATTPMMEEVIDAMLPFQRQVFGNPSIDSKHLPERLQTLVELP